MLDLRYDDKNVQKKQVSMFFSGNIRVQDVINDIDKVGALFYLPPKSLVTRVFIMINTAGTASIDIKVNDTSIVEDQSTATTGIVETNGNRTYFENGGLVSITDSSVTTVDLTKLPKRTGYTAAPQAVNPTVTADNGVVRVGIEYIEVDLTTGKYTN